MQIVADASGPAGMLQQARQHMANEDPDGAMKLASDARMAFEDIGDNAGKAESWIEMVHALMAKGLYEESIDEAKRITGFGEEIGDAKVEAKGAILTANSWSGALAKSMMGHGEESTPDEFLMGEAVKSSHDALDCCRKARDDPGQAMSLYNVSQLYLMKKDYPTCIRFGVVCRNMARGNADKAMEGAAMLCQAQAFYFQEKGREAIDAAYGARTLLEEAGDWEGVNSACTVLDNIEGMSITQQVYEEIGEPQDGEEWQQSFQARGFELESERVLCGLGQKVVAC